MCDAVDQRRAVTNELLKAVGSRPTADGSEKQMLEAYSVLTGIVAEYTDGGDQMAEECTCGNIFHIHGWQGKTLGDVERAYRQH